MGLFSGKEKEDVDNIQTQEIKQATQPQITNNEPDFKNPFAQNQVENSSNNQINQNNITNKLNGVDSNLNPNSSQSTNNSQTNSIDLDINANINQETNANIENSTHANQNSFEEIKQNIGNLNENTQENNYEKIQEMIDETVEKIIEEKWEKLLGSVQKVVDWKEKQERTVNELSENLTTFQENFINFDQKINNKITSYDQNIIDIGTEIKALEKVFQKITPTLVNNVNELRDITADLKSLKESNDSKI